MHNQMVMAFCNTLVIILLSQHDSLELVFYRFWCSCNILIISKINFSFYLRPNSKSITKDANQMRNGIPEFIDT